MNVQDYTSHDIEVALDKVGRPAGFKFYRFEALSGSDVLYTGCVAGVYSKGPRKGKPKYDGPAQRVVVTQAEIAAQREKFERETGLCGECCGKRQVWCGWSVNEGNRYRPCPVCGEKAEAVTP